MKNFLKNNYKNIILIIFVLGLFLTGFLTYYLKFINEFLDLNFNGDIEIYKRRFIFLGIIAFLLSLIAFLIIRKANDKNIHKKFFLTALILGMFYIFIIPLFSQSDEPAHFLRAYEISEGYIKTPNAIGDQRSNYFNQELVNDIYGMGDVAEYRNYDENLILMKEKHNKNINTADNKEIVVRANNYSVVSYFPHSIGIYIGNLFNLNTFYCGILGRIFSLIFCTVLLALGIKIIPKGKFFMSMILLSPAVLSYISSFSADGTTITYCFLLFAFILNFVKTKKELKKTDYLILLLLVSLVSLSKTVYVPLIFSVILIPKECFKNRKGEIISKIILIIFGILIDVLWLKYASFNSESVDNNSWIYTHLLKYFIVIFRTILSNGYNQLVNLFAGNYLCHGQVDPYQLISSLFLIIYSISFFSEKRDYNFKKIIYFLIVLVGIGIYGLVCTAMYEANTEQYGLVIIGVQGRYLFPILLLSLFFKNNCELKINKKYLYFINIFLTFLVFMTMISTFII